MKKVERIVSGELGVRISKAFADFEPAASGASLAGASRVHAQAALLSLKCSERTYAS